jgi:hypothetical protein
LEDNEWSKVKLNIVSENDEVTLVNDDDEGLFSSRMYTTGDTIGLDHIDRQSKGDKTGAIFIRG